MLRIILVPVLTVFALWLFFASPGAGAIAQEGPSKDDAQIVKVGIYVINIGRLEIATGAFTVDFYLTFRCDGTCDPENFEFMNGRANFTDLQFDGPNEKIYRIQASLTADLDMREYPFDSHELRITLEDKSLTSEELIYVVDPETSGIDPAVAVAGWELVTDWGVVIDDHFYPPWNEYYSRYSFSIPIKRATLSAVLKSFFPAVAIVITGLFALFISPSETLARLTINTSAFVGAVLFHLNLTSSVPPLGYLTYADQFMLANYAALLAALTATVTLMFLARSGREASVAAVHRFFLIATPTSWVALQVVIGLMR